MFYKYFFISKKDLGPEFAREAEEDKLRYKRFVDGADELAKSWGLDHLDFSSEDGWMINLGIEKGKGLPKCFSLLGREVKLEDGRIIELVGFNLRSSRGRKMDEEYQEFNALNHTRDDDSVGLAQTTLNLQEYREVENGRMIFTVVTYIKNQDAYIIRVPLKNPNRVVKSTKPLIELTAKQYGFIRKGGSLDKCFKQEKSPMTFETESFTGPDR